MVESAVGVWVSVALDKSSCLVVVVVVASLVWSSRSHTLSTSVAPLRSLFQPSTNFTGTKHFLGEKKKNENEHVCVRSIWNITVHHVYTIVHMDI